MWTILLNPGDGWCTKATDRFSQCMSQKEKQKLHFTDAAVHGPGQSIHVKTALSKVNINSTKKCVINAAVYYVADINQTIFGAKRERERERERERPSHC